MWKDKATAEELLEKTHLTLSSVQKTCQHCLWEKIEDKRQAASRTQHAQ